MAKPYLLALVVAAPRGAAALAPSCSGHGSFSVWHGKLGCVCDPGWGGWDCGTPICAPACAHGTCHAPNSCVCKDGWGGAACDTRLCPSACSGHGTCVDGSCVCDSLFTGSDCSLRACAGNCSGHGVCQSNNVCKCDEGWHSLDCSIATCPRDCSAHGDCGADGRCRCVAGWTGVACDELACVGDCGAHGACAHGVCVCAPGWGGEVCDEPDEADHAAPVGALAALPTEELGARCPSDCSGHGRCTPSGVCLCGGGWSGADCSVAPCPTSPAAGGLPCSAHGECERNGFGHACRCFSGYTGVACETKVGCVGGCGSHGHCRDGSCACDVGWTGAHCDARACVGGCGGHGRCEDGKCACYPGWDGERCDEPTCPNGCSGHGRCLEGGVCACTNGWQGEDCSVHRGCPDDCLSRLGRGHCVGSPGVCACADGFTGDNCGRAVAAGIVSAASAAHRPLPAYCSAATCGEHGRCGPPGSPSLCACDPGWRGERCELLACGASANHTQAAAAGGGACGAHGTCVDGACRCDAGYVATARGLHCAKECPLDCHSPFGRCVDGACVCADGYGGDDCAAVLCPGGCSGRGQCGADGRCSCLPGFGGADCSVRLCASNCSGHGTCMTPLSTAAQQQPPLAAAHAARRWRPSGVDSPVLARCVCDDGWVGMHCEVPACPNRCSGRGRCMANGQCACFGGWKGVDCQERRCPLDASGNECSGATHGRCTRAGHCRCLPGWRGGACERPSCAGTPPCNNRGPCLVGLTPGAGLTARCACEAPFAGDACEVALCPSNCSGHGECLQPPHVDAGRCVCLEGWRGADCSQRACPGGCSGRGDCSDDGVCICDAGWGGARCEAAECPGDALRHVVHHRLAANGSATAPWVAALRAGGGPSQGCGAHGVCDASRRVCVCADGWTGPDCAQRACPANCNGRGVCGAKVPGECVCEAHFTGAACERHVRCASGCSNHGVCDEVSGLCACHDGWSGADCEHAVCAPGPRGEPPCLGRGRCLDGACECDADGASSAHCRTHGRCMHGCNGHGACNATSGVCVCEPGWTGEWCQAKQCERSCGRHGTCVQGECACDAGWEGASCDRQRCVGTGGKGGGCGAYGTCVQPDEEGGLARCRCKSGWAGADCSVPAAHV